jgi:hypothetical protein
MPPKKKASAAAPPAPPGAPGEPLTFFDLPQELRHKIIFLSRKDPVPPEQNRKILGNLSLVSKQMREDVVGAAAASVWRSIPLVVHVNTVGTLCSFSQWMLAHIRDIQRKAYVSRSHYLHSTCQLLTSFMSLFFFATVFQ